MPAVHASPFSGKWYPAGAAALDRLLEEQFAESRRRTGPYLLPAALGYVVPHAGPEYSGTVAASVYRSLRQQKPQRIVLLAFPHHGGLRGAAVPELEAISTPLGSVPIDGFLSARFPRVAEGRVCDHSFEIQLPFLQKAAPGARLCPLYVGSLSDAERHTLAEDLAAEWEPGTVLIASSDFTHYGRSFGYVPFPPGHHVAERLRALDFACIEASSSLDPFFFLQTLSETGATVCGSAPISLLLEALRLIGPDGLFQSTLDYQTSGEITGDYHRSVSYAALGYYRRDAFCLCQEDRAALLVSAETTLQRLSQSGRPEPVKARGSIALESRLGAFVSLHRGNNLLGCMGRCPDSDPLAEAVPRLALSAALEDPRFPPGEALAGPFSIEISVLTPLRRILREAEFQAGRHGGLLQSRGRSGLLLPQVAHEHGWNTEDFLRALEVKAGLEPNAIHAPEARLSAFEAQVFSRERP